ncbi:hypothetical protein RSOLAG1IB_04446 [Rhizoctonia solani AG-1 IB]|uniref:EF-hand domain-containing protein n=1 Tax=Thanatephorus cucumeris (strain AG1-IB / isolate 7/3/14) TaxID=1108050 RepID=A0A0B7FUR7_THACB|nr:hypothetical protein RSOLAG1IB_04446 [Rhizoctonia solani AG-1 IB]
MIKNISSCDHKQIILGHTRGGPRAGSARFSPYYCTNRSIACDDLADFLANMNGQNYGLKAKDFSDFSKSKSIFESHAGGDPSRQSRISAGIATTESQLEAAKMTIANPSVISRASKVTKQVISTLLAPAKSLAELLGIVSEAIPPTEPIAEVFRGLLRLELDRQDNDKRIATLYLSMSAMLVILAKLDSVFNEEGDLSDLLDRKLDDIVNLLNDFGNFCDVYYKHRTVVRFLRITRYNDLINDFAESFISTRQELETLILNHTTLVVMQTSNTVNLIARELSELTQFMNTQTTREREAQDLIKAKGGVEKVVKDNDLICEVSTKLGDPIRSSAQTKRSIQYSLNEDLGCQMKDNHALFMMKLTSVKEELAEAINKSTVTILTRLDAGPHEIINDPDIKAIWQEMKWRNTAKSRQFVSAIQYHFEQKFSRYMKEHEGAQHPDCWTLNYLSRVIFYPAIADAIDEDSSGYISLHELNNFFDSRPKDWTATQWLAYWAAGWYQDNLQYRDKIMARLSAFESSVEGLRPENKGPLQDYLSEVAENVKLIADSLYSNVLEYFEAESAETVNLASLREKYVEYVTKEVEERLDQANYKIDDPHTLNLIVGVGNRLEARLLCIIHRLLKRHHKIFDIAKDKPLQEGITVSMTTSLQVIFETFTKRTRALMESWRQQRLDADLQAEWYAYGLFEEWYKKEKGIESEEDYDDEDLSEEDATDEEQEEIEEQATCPPTEVGSVIDPTEARSDEEGIVDEVADGDSDPEVMDSEGDDVEGDDDDDDDKGSPRGHSSHPRTNYERGVERRLTRLEGRMDELKDLMLKILERLDN